MSMDQSTTNSNRFADVNSDNFQLPVIPELNGKILSMEGFPALGLEDPAKPQKRLRMVGVFFPSISKIVDLDAGQTSLKWNDNVVADIPDKGVLLGRVARSPYEIDNTELRLQLPPILRLAQKSDLDNFERQKKLETEALMRVQSAVSRHNLNMNVFKVNYTLDMKKAFVYFLSPDRVDFRSLLKDLVHDLKAKIELRQVGERDDARMKGGIGPCGEELCCSRFINKFQVVNVKMAKDQDLSLKPSRVTGACGRLKCCLAHEENVYLDARKHVPSRGKCVKCKNTGQCGVVRDVNFLTEKVVVSTEDGSMVTFQAADLVEDRTRKSQYEGRGSGRGGEQDSEDILSDDLDKLEG